MGASKSKYFYKKKSAEKDCTGTVEYDEENQYLHGPPLVSGKAWEESAFMYPFNSPPPKFFAQLLQDLLNRDYIYLLSVIIGIIMAFVLIFWIPIVIVVLLDSVPGTSIRNVISPVGALAFSFSSLFSVTTNYMAVSTVSVFIVTFEVVLGKLLIASLTALLVLKISRTPSHIVQSHRLLIHKRNGKWTLSMRVAILYGQRIYNPKMTLSSIAKTVKGWMPATLEWDNHCLGHGFGRLDGLPLNLRHVVDENSPLRSINFESEQDVRASIFGIIFTVSGFDKITGRNVGHEQRFDWKSHGDTRGLIYYAPDGEMSDVLLNSNKIQKIIESKECSTHDKFGVEKFFKKYGVEMTAGVDWAKFHTIQTRRTVASEAESN